MIDYSSSVSQAESYQPSFPKRRGISQSHQGNCCGAFLCWTFVSHCRLCMRNCFFPPRAFERREGVTLISATPARCFITTALGGDTLPLQQAHGQVSKNPRATPSVPVYPKKLCIRICPPSNAEPKKKNEMSRATCSIDSRASPHPHPQTWTFDTPGKIENLPCPRLG